MINLLKKGEARHSALMQSGCLAGCALELHAGAHMRAYVLGRDFQSCRFSAWREFCQARDHTIQITADPANRLKQQGKVSSDHFVRSYLVVISDVFEKPTVTQCATKRNYIPILLMQLYDYKIVEKRAKVF